jgi:hypothetical protein
MDTVNPDSVQRVEPHERRAVFAAERDVVAQVINCTVSFR